MVILSLICHQCVTYRNTKKEDNDEQNRPKRKVEKLPQCLRSPFMIHNEKDFRRIDAHKKMIAEYGFADGDNE